MLEIVFDESSGNSFLGRKYKTAKLTSCIDFAAYRRQAAEVIAAYGDEPAVFIDFDGGDDELGLTVLALSVEAYGENHRLESAVFKVKNSVWAMSACKPYTALANSLRYARDLYRLPAEEMYADIKRLGYLGLKTEEDYLKGEIVMCWPGDGDAEILRATGKSEAIVATGVLKTLAICKYEKALTAVLVRRENAPELSEDEIINEIIAKVREKNAKR